jgi:hypothetical protein
MHYTQKCTESILSNTAAKSAYYRQHICPTICLSAWSTSLPIDGLSSNLIFGAFTNICRTDSNLAKIGQKQLAFYTDTSVRLHCWQQYEIFCSSTMVQRAFARQQHIYTADSYMYVKNMMVMSCSVSITTIMTPARHNVTLCVQCLPC